MLFGCNLIEVLLFSIWITIFFACNNFIRNFFFKFYFICAESGGKWVGVLCFVYKIILNQLNCLLILNGGKRYQVFYACLFSFVTEIQFYSSSVFFQLFNYS